MNKHMSVVHVAHILQIEGVFGACQCPTQTHVYIQLLQIFLTYYQSMCQCCACPCLRKCFIECCWLGRRWFKEDAIYTCVMFSLVIKIRI